MSNIELDESNVLRDAVKDGLIPTQLPVFDKIDLKVFDYATDNFKPQKFPQKDSQFAPETQRYQEHHFDVYNLPGNAQRLVELARIIVPRGDVGYLKSIEQFVADQDGGFFPTGSEYWGVPYQNDPDVLNLRWYLRLSNFEGEQPARFVGGASIYNLPGWAFPDLPEIDYLWYPAHCVQKMPNMVIPGGTMLRFFILSLGSTVWQWRVMGRLRAVVQSSQCAEMYYNTRISAW